VKPALTVRLIWAISLLLTAGRPGRSDRSREVSWTARALALRHLAESAILVRRRTETARLPAWTVWIDATHGASMVAAAVVSPKVRRPALVSATAAFGISAVSELERRA
jgi:hypothetical protein